MDAPEPGRREEIIREAEEEARNPRQPDLSQRLAKWMLFAFLASPFLLLAAGNAVTQKEDVKVTQGDHLACFLQCFNAVSTDQGTFEVQDQDKGKLQEGKRYRLVIENMSTGPVMQAGRGTIKSFEPIP